MFLIVIFFFFLTPLAVHVKRIINQIIILDIDIYDNHSYLQ